MLKTIESTKKMRLYELIKYAWENDIKNTIYESDKGQIVKFLGNGRYESGWNFGYHDSFTVRVEEEITEKTEFNILVKLFYEDGEYCTLTYYNSSVRDIKDDTTIFIYVLLDEGLECIWDVRINGEVS